MKVVYLAIENAAKKWSMPLRDWKPAINQFMIMYQDGCLILVRGSLHRFFFHSYNSVFQHF
jgi:hypothetical protein